MEILEKISELKKSIKETDLLIEELISSLNAYKLRSENRDEKISKIKEEVKINIEKIDEFIEDYNANS
tara:strand:- start:243 stop:446 length:204 start_codon:yes stop_codon:yes gene_type:complete